MAQLIDKALETEDRYFQLASKDLVYLKFVLEAYEGLCTMSTVDGKRGIVKVNYPLPFAEDVHDLLEALCGEIALIEVGAGGEPCCRS
ncbi:DUF4911 domain-containing protein [Geomonas silvestris]|uniref:DUF4911 domain-containing protein n=1 Tax=Geomonas silvestris TaxID=2740184 RepID=A0A6V8ME54_9BACT|nr:DUF4911 domain-containing protein [Geomonas silvestris]GFO58237.1 DUF4911 domain-containing protein [Geomonas silvestris]